MPSSSSNSSRQSKIELRNKGFYLKKYKTFKHRGNRNGFGVNVKNVIPSSLFYNLAPLPQLNEQEPRTENDPEKSFNAVQPDDGENDNSGQMDGVEESYGDKEQPHVEVCVDADPQNQSDIEQMNDLDDGNDDLTPPVNDADDTDTSYRLKKEEWREKERKRYKDLKKDMIAINEKIDPLIKEFKTIKSLIKRLDIGREPSTEDEMEEFDELPRLPLKKLKHVNLMEENIRNNRIYKKQLIAKLRTIGGSDIKKTVINIFKVLFSTKLKTKICWTGSTVKGKAAFQGFPQILDALRQAVKSRHKKCTADDIEKECKLRFKQAEKDYDRELYKQL